MASTTVAKLPPYPSHPYRKLHGPGPAPCGQRADGYRRPGPCRVHRPGRILPPQGLLVSVPHPCGRRQETQTTFLPHTSWDSIWERYVFDQELRTIVFDGIVGIEVHLKSYMASELAKATGPFGYTVPDGLTGLSPEEHGNAIANITSDYQRSSLPQLRHFKSTYSGCRPSGCWWTACPTVISRRSSTRVPTLRSNGSWHCSWASCPTSPASAMRNCCATGLRTFGSPATRPPITTASGTASTPR